jgi:hypothetical protein
MGSCRIGIAAPTNVIGLRHHDRLPRDGSGRAARTTQKGVLNTRSDISVEPEEICRVVPVLQ